MADERDRWIAYIKSVRQQHGVSIFDAERIALTQPEWRRWVERQISSDLRCRRMAIRHLREHGDASLIVQQGSALKVR